MATPDRPDDPGLSRRTLFTIGLGAFVLATLPRARAAARRRRTTRTAPTMGTVAEVTVVHEDERIASSAIDAALAELARVDRTMTRFSGTSDVGRANRLAAREPVPVSPETATVVATALAWAEASDGSFDPSLERLSEIWDVGSRHEPPEAGLFRRYAGRRLWGSVEVGRTASGPVLRYLDPDAALDLGAIAKGYGVDRAAAALRAHGVRDALVNAGGEIVAMGRNESGDPWRVGIRSPEDPGAIVGEIDLVDAAVATSGDYEQYFDWHGRRYHHILDWETAEPRRTALHSVTILAPTCMEADAASTAVFGLARPEAERILARRPHGARLVGTA